MIPVDPVETVCLSIRRCSHCNAVMFSGEGYTNCCDGGQKIIREEDWPRLPDDYKSLLQSTQLFTSLQSQSSFINGKLALGRIHVDGSGFSFGLNADRGASFFCNTVLCGRTYHAFSVSAPCFSYLKRIPVEEEYAAILRIMFGYLLHNHPSYVGLTSLSSLSQESLRVEFHPEYAPVSQSERALIGSRIGCLHSSPRIRYVNGPGREFQNLGREMPYETIIFPLLLPKGVGGYYHLNNERFPHSTSGEPLKTVWSFYARVFYQRADDFALLPRVAETLLLDVFSRGQEIQFDKMLSEFRKNNGRRRTTVAEMMRTGGEGRCGKLWNLPASISGNRFL